MYICSRQLPSDAQQAEELGKVFTIASAVFIAWWNIDQKSHE